jgi:hypothetical protein
MTREIYCCGCGRTVSARLTDGAEIYPHRSDLSSLPFWKCDACGNYVGCHHKTRDRTRPLGVIPTAEIKKAHQHIHRVFDPLWKSGRMSRGKAYRELAKAMGRDEYHTAEIRTVEEAREVYRKVREIAWPSRVAPTRPVTQKGQYKEHKVSRRHEDKAHLDFIRSLPCLVCGAPGPNDGTECPCWEKHE